MRGRSYIGGPHGWALSGAPSHGILPLRVRLGDEPDHLVLFVEVLTQSWISISSTSDVSKEGAWVVFPVSGNVASPAWRQIAAIVVSLTICTSLAVALFASACPGIR